MKRTLIVTLLLAVLLAACGPAEAPVTEAPASSEAASSESSPVVESSAAVETSSSEAPASSSTESSAAPVEVVEVQVVLGDNWVQSSLETFKVGVPYRLVITNSGGRVHNFNIHPVAEKTDAGVQAALENALLSVPDAQLRPGSQVVVEFTFSEAGTFEFSCLIPRHFKSGQYLAVTVEP